MPVARRGVAYAFAWDRGVWSRPGPRSIPAGIAALGIGFALGLQADPQGFSAFATIHPTSFDLQAPLGSQAPGSPRVRLASLETGVASEFAIESEEMQPASAASSRVRASFDRLFFDPPSALFNERFAALEAPGILRTTEADERANGVVPLPPRRGQHATTPPAVRRSAPDPAPVTSSASAGVSKKGLRTAEAPKDTSSLPDADARTAIYDIAAHTVYLPNGQRLEAHSGLGSHMDDPRYVHVKRQGPTPPNVYTLALREHLFHGVRAIRLTPVGGGKMFGRDGMLAHTYMLGPNGQSNGCVSFSDYPAFLNAFLNGEIERLVVVDHLETEPTQTASGWLSESIKALFSRS